MEDNSPDITVFLKAINEGDELAKNKLAEAVYSSLKRIAANRLKSESWSNTLTVTALAHEAFMKVDETKYIKWKNRRHYFGAIAEAMRRILIDRARHHCRKKREGNSNTIPIDDLGLELADTKPQELIWLNDTLDALDNLDKELVEIIKLKFFVGLSSEDIADLYGVSSRTIHRRWEAARAFLITEMQISDPQSNY